MSTQISPRFQIVRVLGQRVLNGRMQYLVQWSGHPMSDFSWVPPFVIPPELVELYKSGGRLVETSQLAPESTSLASTSLASTSFASTSIVNVSSSDDDYPPVATRLYRRRKAVPRRLYPVSKAEATRLYPVQEAVTTRLNPVAKAIKENRNGFELNWGPKKIIRLTRKSGFLEFLMTWERTPLTQFVPADLAKVKCPQLVIQYYESLITWNHNRPIIDPNASDSDSD